MLSAMAHSRELYKRLHRSGHRVGSKHNADAPLPPIFSGHTFDHFADQPERARESAFGVILVPAAVRFVALPEVLVEFFWVRWRQLIFPRPDFVLQNAHLRLFDKLRPRAIGCLIF